MPEITRITKTFEYDMPDAYLYQTSTLNKKGTFTYKGPRYLWIFADAETGKIKGKFHYTEADNGAVVPTPEGQIKIMVDADVNPLIASLVHNEIVYGDLPQTVEVLPDGSTYGHPDPQVPDHTVELEEVVYDAATESFVLNYPDCWKKPHMTWEGIIAWRNQTLQSTDGKLKTCTPDKVQAWQDYRQKLRDLPATFAGVDPWKIPFPNDPDWTGINAPAPANDNRG